MDFFSSILSNINKSDALFTICRGTPQCPVYKIKICSLLNSLYGILINKVLYIYDYDILNNLLISVDELVRDCFLHHPVHPANLNPPISHHYFSNSAVTRINQYFWTELKSCDEMEDLFKLNWTIQDELNRVNVSISTELKEPNGDDFDVPQV